MRGFKDLVCRLFCFFRVVGYRVKNVPATSARWKLKTRKGRSVRESPLVLCGLELGEDWLVSEGKRYVGGDKNRRTLGILASLVTCKGVRELFLQRVCIQCKYFARSRSFKLWSLRFPFLVHFWMDQSLLKVALVKYEEVTGSVPVSCAPVVLGGPSMYFLFPFGRRRF